MLTKEQLLQPVEQKPVKVDVMGDYVFVRVISFSEWLSKLTGKDELSRQAQMLAATLCDEQGKQLMTAPEARKFLETQPANICLTLVKAINKLMPFEAAAVDEAEKN